MASSQPGLKPPFATLPLRTASMMSNDIFGSSPLRSRYSIILSRQPMTSAIVQVPERISSSALPVQTSVPWDRPEIWISSEKFFGWASKSIWRTKLVPISGMPKVPVLEPICSSVTPSAAGLVSRL